MSGDGPPRTSGRGLPLDDVGSGDVDLAGRLAELRRPARRRASTALAAASDVGDWMRCLRDGVRALDRRVAGRRLAGRRSSSASSPGRPSRPPAGGRRRAAAWPTCGRCFAARLGGRPTRANFRTGTLTVCTMVPMRSVPHRVVCLVGLDDGVVPAQRGSSTATTCWPGARCTGERDVRSEDRQLLLDAVLAATETLVVTYTGANEHSGAGRPPAVPLGEMLDALDRTTRRARCATACWSATPSSPTTRATWCPARSVGDRPFSFDRCRTGRRPRDRG